MKDIKENDIDKFHNTFVTEKMTSICVKKLSPSPAVSNLLFKKLSFCSKVHLNLARLGYQEPSASLKDAANCLHLQTKLIWQMTFCSIHEIQIIQQPAVWFRMEGKASHRIKHPIRLTFERVVFKIPRNRLPETEKMKMRSWKSCKFRWRIRWNSCTSKALFHLSWK